MTAKEIRDLCVAFANDETLDPIERATGISSIYQITTELRTPAQKAAVEFVKGLGYIGARRTGNIFFMHKGERYTFNSSYRQWKCDHIKEYNQAIRIADTIKKQAIANAIAVEGGMTLGPNDIPPAKFKVFSAFVRRVFQQNGTAFYSKGKRKEGFKDPVPHGD